MKTIKSGKLLSLLLITTLIITSVPFFNLTSAAASINYTIDYINERIIFGDSFTGNSDTPMYMYSPKADLLPSVKKQAVEKWYPIYGNTIEITKYIPKTKDKEVFIAIRLADEYPNPDGTYPSRDTILINGRYNITASALKKLAVYNPEENKVEITGELANGYDYQLGLSEWILNRRSDLPLVPKYNSLGNIMYIRKSASALDKTFASVVYKLKIPKAPNTPRVKVNENTKKLYGITPLMAWSTSENGNYTMFIDKTIELQYFEQKTASVASFQTVSLTDSKTNETANYIAMYVKIPAGEKKPASAVQKVLIKKSLLTQ